LVFAATFGTSAVFAVAAFLLVDFGF
jgi:hypothetical protein